MFHYSPACTAIDTNRWPRIRVCIFHHMSSASVFHRCTLLRLPSCADVTSLTRSELMACHVTQGWGSLHRVFFPPFINPTRSSSAGTRTRVTARRAISLIMWMSLVLRSVVLVANSDESSRSDLRTQCHSSQELAQRVLSRPHHESSFMRVSEP